MDCIQPHLVRLIRRPGLFVILAVAFAGLSSNAFASSQNVPPDTVGEKPFEHLPDSQEPASHYLANFYLDEAAKQIIYQQPALITSESTLVAHLLVPGSYVFETEPTPPAPAAPIYDREMAFELPTTVWILLWALGGILLVGRARRHHSERTEG